MDIRLVDLYGFMRKLMEKYDWDIKLGYLMLREYDRVNTLSSQDIKILGAMFAYPEKFWKYLIIILTTIRHGYRDAAWKSSERL